MQINYCEQQSAEWWALKTARISGTRFGQLISNRKNKLIYKLLDERLDGYAMPDDYVSEDMEFGLENEPIARQLYIEKSGIPFIEVGAIMSDFSDIHMASPDGVDIDSGIVLEVKCTRNGDTHIQRYFEGIDSSYIGQLINYFAVSDDVKEVHFVSFCPSRPERPIVEIKFTRQSIVKLDRTEKTIGEVVLEGRKRIKEIEAELDSIATQFTF